MPFLSRDSIKYFLFPIPLVVQMSKADDDLNSAMEKLKQETDKAVALSRKIQGV